MNLITTLKGLFRPAAVEPDLVHPLFGNMMAEVCGDEDDFWQSEIVFKPLNCDIYVNVLAGSEGPSDAQSEFYEHFVQNYQLDFELVAPALIKEYEEWFQKKLEGTFSDNFEFSGLLIPKNGDRSNPWDLSFDCLADKFGHMFTAEIKDDVVLNVRTDG